MKIWHEAEQAAHLGGKLRAEVLTAYFFTATMTMPETIEPRPNYCGVSN